MIDVFAAFSTVHKKHEVLQLLTNQRNSVWSLNGVQQFLTIVQKVRKEIEFSSNIDVILVAMTNWMRAQTKGKF